jgi:short-subunit dehydrogenase
MAAAAVLRRRWQPRRQLGGMRALVTGGSSGVGRAVARELSRRGARVLVTARRQERLAELAAENPETPLDHEAGDLSDPAFRTRLVESAITRLGGLDLVVAAAGSGAIGSFRTADSQTFARVLDVNLVAPGELVRLCLPELIRGRDSAVVFVGSILGLHPLPLHGEYCAAKSGLRALAGSLRLELAADGVAVMLATLGPVATEFWDSLLVGERPAWSRGTPVSASFVATAILDGLERRRPEVIPGWRAKVYALLARYLPGAIDRFAARQV